jgi:hypothetical protein
VFAYAEGVHATTTIWKMEAQVATTLFISLASWTFRIHLMRIWSRVFRRTLEIFTCSMIDILL